MALLGRYPSRLPMRLLLSLWKLSIEMVSDGLAFGSAGFAEASGFGVSGFFTIGPLQFAVVPGHYLDAEKSGKCGV